MADILSTKEIIQRATLGIPKGMEKISVSIAFDIDIFISFEIILHVE